MIMKKPTTQRLSIGLCAIVFVVAIWLILNKEGGFNNYNFAGFAIIALGMHQILAFINKWTMYAGSVPLHPSKENLNFRRAIFVMSVVVLVLGLQFLSCGASCYG